ncbi:LPS export ABC transporter permease LptG [Albimonas pacifica]|uniref:Lipopolysaccharide export system permease protein n=1 Tax=Albimonas pacifica TaxID=1114924 RepID=A0A1I3KW60_9RHOB|nr:LPS export ABC transporter permease LptG [Albimonas pacifica]SFI76759.1 lipopolysaccharide export system permease protein [Albimonas pacifica]
MIGTLSLYVMRRFVGAFTAAFAAVLLLVVLVDLVEQMRRSAGTATNFSQVLELSLLHAPSLMMEILPFLTLIAALTCFARLARSSELVVTRAAGVSVWRLIAPAVAAAALGGVLAFSVLDPLSAGLLQRFERQEARWIKDRASLLSVSGNGLWLRQAGGEGQTVVHAQRANGDGTQLWRVSLFRFAEGDRLAARVEAARAVLEPGRWVLYDVREWDLAQPTARSSPEGGTPPAGETDAQAQAELGVAPAMGWTDLEQLTLPTELTRAQILESFASPGTISFWALPGFIKGLEAAGVSAARHRMHWQAQLALPLLLPAMVLIGAAFSMRHVRFGGLGLMALGAIGTGLAYFFLANVTQAFGGSGAIAAPLAAWIPPVAMTLFALGLLLHLEDG